MMEQSKYKVLNRDAIKYIAMLTMFLNHVANIFLTPGTILYEVLVDIGYFTAITMCYFLVEGYQYTHSKKNYGIRLLFFAILSEYPFLFAFHGHGVEMNMMFTLFICFLILVVRENVKNDSLKNILVVLLVIVTAISDWAILAAVYTIMFDEWGENSEKIRKAYGIAIVLFGLLNLISNVEMYDIPKAFLCAVGSCMGIVCSGLVIQIFYNGKRAKYGTKFSKWFFYIFYPAHLLLLGFVNQMF